MQQTRMKTIKYPTLLMLNKSKLENHQQSLLPPNKHQNHEIHTTNPKNIESHNMMPKTRSIISYKGLSNLLGAAPHN